MMMMKIQAFIHSSHITLHLKPHHCRTKLNLVEYDLDRKL